jgi:hypothetical protein
MQVVDRKCLTTLLLHTRDPTLVEKGNKSANSYAESRWNLGLGRGSPQLSPRYLANLLAGKLLRVTGMDPSSNELIIRSGRNRASSEPGLFVASTREQLE